MIGATNLSKTERIDVRASTLVKQLQQEAARASQKNVSEFLLDAEGSQESADLIPIYARYSSHSSGVPDARSNSVTSDGNVSLRMAATISGASVVSFHRFIQHGLLEAVRQARQVPSFLNISLQQGQKTLNSLAVNLRAANIDNRHLDARRSKEQDLILL